MPNDMRHPAGIPVGGQYAVGQHPDSEDLTVPYDEPPYGYDDPGEPPEGMFLPGSGFEEEGNWAQSEAELYDAFQTHGASLDQASLEAMTNYSAETSSTLRKSIYGTFGYTPTTEIPALDDAFCALQNRDSVHGGTAWNPEAYREMTLPWRKVFGEFHPGDEPWEYDSAATPPPDGFDEIAKSWLPGDNTPPF